MSDVERVKDISAAELAAKFGRLRAETDELRGQLAGFRRTRRRSRLALLVGAAVVLVVGGGVAYAVIPDAGTGVIHGCYDNTSGALRVIDPSSGSCTGSETALDWNARGIDWRGAWNSAASYAVGDVVAYNGSSYIAVAANTHNRPGSVSWAVLAAGLQQHGAWSAATTYWVGSVVTYQGSSYRATKESKNDLPTDASRWALLASKGDQGDPGSDGATVLNGSGAPDDSLGADGDFYLDTTANAIYGPKAGGNWPASGTSLIGPKGDTGDTGPAGPGSTVISMTITSGDEYDSRAIPNSDLSADWSCEAGEPVYDGITVSQANFNLYAADAPGLQLSGVNTSTGNPALEAGASTSTQPYYPQLSFPENGVAAFDAGYDTSASTAQIQISTEPAQGDAGATYSHFTLVHGSSGATLDLYLQADNTSTPSCTVTAIITPTS